MEGSNRSDRRPAATPAPDYHELPPLVRLDDTIASVDPGPTPDPERHLDLHKALRDH